MPLVRQCRGASHKAIVKCLLIVVAGVTAGQCFASQEGLTLPGRKFEGPRPVIDGRLSEGEWKEAAPANGFVDPVTEAKTADDTRIWMAYDDDAIYIAAHCYDAHPEKIVAREIQRGAYFNGEDTLQFQIDPFHRRSSWARSNFTVNALGTQNEQIDGGRSSKREWRGDWQAASKRTSDGWVVEMRIPWEVLNLPGCGRRDLDINFRRYQARTKVNGYWSNETLNPTGERCGIWTGVELPNVARKLDVMGYVAPEYDDTSDHRWQLRSGVDVRYGFTPQITGLLSVNPDFRNIEQQVAGIEFTRSERLLDEARPFFTEGSDFFWLSNGHGFGRMFYSRRIEDFTEGAKAYGRFAKDYTFGALYAKEGSRGDDVVLKFARDFGPRGSVTAYTTARTLDGSDSATYGGNFSFAKGLWFTDGEAAATNSDGLFGSAGLLGIGYQAPRMFAVLRYVYNQPSFEPSLGYVGQADQRGAYIYSEYNNEYRKGAISSAGGWLNGWNYRNYAGGNRSRGLAMGGYLNMRNDFGVSFNTNHTEYGDEVERTLTLGVGFNMSNRHKRLMASYNFGERADQTTRYLSLDGSLRVLRAIDLGLSFANLDYEGTAQQTVFTVGWEMDKRRTLTSRYVNNGGHDNYYLAFRNAGYGGIDWYLIVGDPNAEQWTGRVSMKAVWAL